MKRSANVVQDPVPPTRWRWSSRCRSPAAPLDAAEDEPQLHLHVGAAGTVVDHRAIGHDPDIALTRGRGRVPLGMGPEDGVLPGRHLGFDARTLLLDPAMQLAVADRQPAQLIERPGRLGVAELGDEPEGPLPDPERVLHPRCETERPVERHDRRHRRRSDSGDVRGRPRPRGSRHVAAPGRWPS